MMKTEFKSVKIFADVKSFDQIGALINTFDIDSFYETEEALIAYYGDGLVEQDLIEFLEELKTKFEMTYQLELTPLINWNEEWEAGFTPIYVDDFVCIHADFHKDLSPAKHYIEINPKMSFGTGHHETTYMMMAAMRNLDLTSKSVMDLGCGTSVLAILAEKLGAKPVFAIDYDQLCFDNSEENIRANNCTGIELALGTLGDVPSKRYDLILANINRGVLMSVAQKLHSYLVPQGRLLISGILEADKELVLKQYESASFQLEAINQKGDWLCILFTTI